jgi:hypothetical protein
MRTAAKSFCYAAQGCSKDFAKAISGDAIASAPFVHDALADDTFLSVAL